MDVANLYCLNHLIKSKMYYFVSKLMNDVVNVLKDEDYFVSTKQNCFG